MKKKRAIAASLVALLVLSVSSLFANKTGVVINVPQSVKKGTDVRVVLEVTHDGNNFLHHTEWVYLKVNGVESKRWEFSAFNTPESGNFSLQVAVKADGNLLLEAAGNCNIHGSQGKDAKTVRAE